MFKHAGLADSLLLFNFTEITGLITYAVLCFNLFTSGSFEVGKEILLRGRYGDQGLAKPVTKTTLRRSLSPLIHRDWESRPGSVSDCREDRDAQVVDL